MKFPIATALTLLLHLQHGLVTANPIDTAVDTDTVYIDPSTGPGAQPFDGASSASGAPRPLNCKKINKQWDRTSAEQKARDAEAGLCRNLVCDCCRRACNHAWPWLVDACVSDCKSEKCRNCKFSGSD